MVLQKQQILFEKKKLWQKNTCKERGGLLRSCLISRNNCLESECMGSSGLKKKQVNNCSKILSLIKNQLCVWVHQIRNKRQ